MSCGEYEHQTVDHAMVADGGADTTGRDGPALGAKGKAGVLDDVTITIDLRDKKRSHWPFGSWDRRSRFEPQRNALEERERKVVEELLQPRSSFQGPTLETPWSNASDLKEFSGSSSRRRGGSSRASQTAVPCANCGRGGGDARSGGVCGVAHASRV
jgi:hypothetical protein